MDEYTLSIRQLFPVGAKIVFAEEKMAYTVRRLGTRFAILTKPFNLHVRDTWKESRQHVHAGVSLRCERVLTHINQTIQWKSVGIVSIGKRTETEREKIVTNIRVVARLLLMTA